MANPNSEASWERMCDIAERLGLVTPESVPYLEGWAEDIKWRLDIGDKIIDLIYKIETAKLNGFIGFEAAKLQTTSAAEIFATSALNDRENYEKIEWHLREASELYQSRIEYYKQSLYEKLHEVKSILSIKLMPDLASKIDEILAKI